jgi:ribonucleoside-diphosphate reductase alpha chain
MRFPVQRRRAGHTITATIGGEQFTLVANQRADGTLGEVFIRSGKHGSSDAGLLDSYATALSVGLAHQVPLADLLRSGLDLHFTPSGHTDDPEIPRVRSVADYLARRLAIDWLPYPERAALGVYTLTERVALAGSWMRTQDPAMCWEMAASV